MTAATLAQATQLEASRALMRILGTPGLAAASWRINLDAEVVGHLEPVDGQDDRAEVARFAEALRLAVEPERFVPSGSRPFTSLNASGRYEGVAVRVWAAVYDCDEAADPAVDGGTL